MKQLIWVFFALIIPQQAFSQSGAAVDSVSAHRFSVGISPFFGNRAMGYEIRAAFRIQKLWASIGMSNFEITNPAGFEFSNATLEFYKVGLLSHKPLKKNLGFEFQTLLLYGKEVIESSGPSGDTIWGMQLSPKLVIQGHTSPLYLGVGAYYILMTSEVYPNDAGGLIEIGFKF